jgi:hypothetical protein
MYPLIDVSVRMTGSGMGDVTNLNKFRKRAEKERSEQEAAANRAKFGRTRSEREREEARDQRAREVLDQHHIDGGEASS